MRTIRRADERRARAPRRALGIGALVAIVMLALAIPAWAQVDQPKGDPAPDTVVGTESVNAEATGKVLILSTSVSGGASSKEAVYATSLGFGVDVVDAATWGAMTTAQFDAYDGIILGDPTCQGSSAFEAATANAAVWTPVVDGNIIVNGTDPIFHYSQGGQVLTEKSIAFALSRAGATNLYFSLTCSQDNSGSTILNHLSPGWTWGNASCSNEIHVVATNAILVGLTDDVLSNWSCSVHEFASAFPSDFVPIAIDVASTAPKVFTAPDGTQGAPYVLGRGDLALGNILLTPATGTQDAGVDYALVALVQEGGTAISGATVTFTCTMPGEADVTGTGVTSTAGFATFVYTRLAPGQDTCTASFVNSKAIKETSNSVTVDWTGTVVLTPTFTG